MADLITLSDGTTTINLNSGSASGFTTEGFVFPKVTRQVARVSGFPFVNGSRTVASALQDATATWSGYIRDTTIDAMEVLYQDLVVLLEQAQQWEEQHIGKPVRLAYKRQGATNTAYWVVTGVSLPEPASEPRQMSAEAAQMLRITFTVTVEPVAHAGALHTILTATGLANHPSTNRTTAAETTGSMAGPLYLKVKKTTAAPDWTQLWVAICPMVPQFGLGGGVPEGGTVSGFPWVETTTSTTGDLLGLTYTLDADIFKYAVRHVTRLRLDSGDPAQVQVRYAYKLGFDVGGVSPVITGPWVTLTADLGEWTLYDLGTASKLMQPILDRTVIITLGEVQAYFQLRTIDGSSATLSCDYVEWIPYLSFAKFTSAGLQQNNSIVYEAVRNVDGFVFAGDPVSYQLTSGDILDTLSIGRHGQLQPLAAGTTPVVWYAGQGAAHDHTATANITLAHLPTYALGLRGNL